MTDHPITPLHELIYQWKSSYLDAKRSLADLLTEAYQTGADQELEACCEWLRQNVGRWEIPEALHDARRPKPPSLKEQAQRILVENGTTLDGRIELEPDDIITIRRALEALPDD